MLHSLFTSMHISASGLSVQRTRLNIISENIANADTTRTAEGGPYIRKQVVVESGNKDKKFAEVLQENKIALRQTAKEHLPDEEFTTSDEKSKAGVHVASITTDDSPIRMEYNPSHPDANADGYVAMPNVNIMQEMVDLVTASRMYEANVTALNSSKDMIRKALRI